MSKNGITHWCSIVIRCIYTVERDGAPRRPAIHTVSLHSHLDAEENTPIKHVIVDQLRIGCPEVKVEDRLEIWSSQGVARSIARRCWTPRIVRTSLEFLEGIVSICGPNKTGSNSYQEYTRAEKD